MDARASHWKPLGDKRIQCGICPRNCVISEGKRGFCFVRANNAGEMVLTTYGRSSGFCVDPVEKKPLNHFLPGTPILSFGTAGCNLGCVFCQNWSISKSKEMDTIASHATPKDIAAAAESSGSRSVAFTYNDPVIFHEYAIDTAQACHERGIKTVAVTAGYHSPEAREDFYRHIDATNVDLKSFSDDFYQNHCSASLQPVLDTLLHIRHQTDCWLEITTLLIPGENDSDSEIDELTRWIHDELGADVPLHFTAFHPDFKMGNKKRTTLETVRRARNIGQENGLKFVYTGNVNDLEGASTWCASCKKLLIGRDWYEMSAWNLVLEEGKGRCRFCGEGIAGVFEPKPGDWGSKRQPIRP